jgi:hypothetical protein
MESETALVIGGTAGIEFRRVPLSNRDGGLLCHTASNRSVSGTRDAFDSASVDELLRGR